MVVIEGLFENHMISIVRCMSALWEKRLVLKEPFPIRRWSAKGGGLPTNRK